MISIITFDSNSLEKLSFKYLYAYTRTEKAIESIDFNTPNLSSLVFWIDYYVRRPIPNIPVKFSFPLKIRHLECIQFDSSLSVLKNLETLICQKIVVPFKLNHFKLLLRLELSPKMEEELEYIRGIIEEKQSLRRDSLVIIVCGFQDLLAVIGEGHQRIASSFELNEHFFRQVADHSEKLVGHIPWKFSMNFSAFYKTFKEIPKDFSFFKLVHIEHIRVSDDSEIKRRRNTPDPSYVLQLLTQSNPESVRIGYKFDMEFYRQLTSIQSIKNLHLFYVDERFEKLNLDEFLKLENLRSFSICKERLPIDFISKLFKLKFMKDFFFSCSKFYFGTTYLSDPQIHLNFVFQKKRKANSRDFSESFDCLDDLIDRIKELTQDTYFRKCLF